MQYLWTAWDPGLGSGEYLIHTPIYGSPGSNAHENAQFPQARTDSYLIILGFFLMLEHFDELQRLFKSGTLKYLGRRSLSYVLVQSPIMYTMGIKLCSHLRLDNKKPYSGAVVAVLVTTLAVAIPVTELFYRLVKLPSKALTHAFYDWMVKE